MTGSASNPTALARVARAERTLVLDISPDVLQLGILDSIVAAAFLLQCGRNID